MNLFDALKVNGKAVHLMYDGVYHLDQCGLKYDLNGRTYLASISFNASLDDGWEPYKEPCKHESRGFPDAMTIEKLRQSDFYEFFHCKFCGVKIEPTGWREIK